MNGIVNRRGHGAVPITGGLLWIAHYLLHLGYGLATGRLLWEAGDTPLRRLDGLMFFGAYLLVGLSLLGLRARLEGRVKALGLVAACVAIFAALAGAAALAATLVLREPETVYRVSGPAGVLSLFAAAILFGVALLLARTRPPSAAAAVLLFGLLTLPMALALPSLERFVPLYAVEELHFVFAGMVWGAVGGVLRGGGEMHDDASSPAARPAGERALASGC